MKWAAYIWLPGNQLGLAMSKSTTCPRWLLVGGLLAPWVVEAQAPVITTVAPAPNAQAVARTAPLTVSFSQPLTAASAGALQVFSSLGGRRTRGATPAVVSGNTLSFAPGPRPYWPGEAVQYTVTTAATGSGGALAKPWVGQFRAAVGGPGRGYLQAGTPVQIGTGTTYLLTGDLNADGNLDVVGLGTSNAVSVCRGNGSGGYQSGSATVGGTSPYSVPFGLALGDVDGDGDLDLVAAVAPSSNSLVNNAISVCFNNGAGTFSAPQLTATTGTGPLVLGDLDGDGDLDLAVSMADKVAVRLNTGAGAFAGGTDIATNVPELLALGDLDNDGDLDLLALCRNCQPNNLAVCTNDGTGSFSKAPLISLNGSQVTCLVLSDMNGDGYLDAVTSDYYGTVGVYRNSGTGSFNAATATGLNLNAGGNAVQLAVGDIDGDGDPDVLALTSVPPPSSTTTLPGVVSICLNDGAGNLSSNLSQAVSSGPGSIALADLDNDGDLDTVVSSTQDTNNHQSPIGWLGTSLNGIALAATPTQVGPAATLYPNPVPGGTATLTGCAPRAAVEIRNALGAVVYRTTTDAGGTAALLSTGLAPGLYLVRTGGQVLQLVVE